MAGGPAVMRMSSDESSGSAVEDTQHFPEAAKRRQSRSAGLARVNGPSAYSVPLHQCLAICTIICGWKQATGSAGRV